MLVRAFPIIRKSPEASIQIPRFFVGFEYRLQLHSTERAEMSTERTPAGITIQVVTTLAIMYGLFCLVAWYAGGVVFFPFTLFLGG